MKKPLKFFSLSFAIVATLFLTSCGMKKYEESKPIIEEKNGVKLYKFKVGDSVFVMNPVDGARLMTWDVVPAKGESRSVVYWPKDAPVGGNLEKVGGGASILFPFSGSSFVDGKPDIWKTPTGKICPMKKHGFANGGKFEVVACSGDSIDLKFVKDEYSKKAYPFGFDFYVSYKFFPKSYILEMTMENREDIDLPWGVGYHPYFTVPWKKGKTHADYRMLIDCNSAMYINNNNGEFTPANDFRENMSLDSKKPVARIHGDLRSGVVKFGLKDGSDDITIIMDDDAKSYSTATVVTYGKPMESPFWCVEPWIVPPASASKALQKVPARGQKTFKIEVKLQ